MTKFINLWDNKKTSTVFLHTKEGIKEIPYKWYFCVKKDDAVNHRKLFEDLYDRDLVDFEDEKTGWIKVYVAYQKKENVLTEIRPIMTTYEDDLPLWKRFLVDEDLELDLDQKILYFDIETDDLKRGIIPGSERIVSIAAINNENEEFFYSDIKNEKKILEWFIDLQQKHHILSGWHSEGFDLVAIKRRCDKYELPFGCMITEWSAKDMGGLDSVRKTGKERVRPLTFNHIDLMQKMKELHYRDTELIKKVRSFGLEAVSSVILGKHKVDLKGETIYNLARKKPDLLKEYNLQDVRLLKELDDKLHIIRQKLIEHWVCGARINDYTSHGKIDPYALREARKMGTRLLSKPNDLKEFVERRDDDRGKTKGDYAGGYVFEPIKGLHQNVHAFDFQSLYPSIIKTFNVSLDSYYESLGDHNMNEMIVMPTGALFSKKTQGVIPKIIQNILDQRDQIRKVEMMKYKKDSEEYLSLHYRQYAFKVLANSMYGIMGASFSRYYKRELAEGITLTGQYLLKTVSEFIEGKGYTRIYGDTDSLFVTSKVLFDPNALAQEIDSFLQRHLEEKFNANKGHLHLNYEASYKRFILVAKKKYIGETEKGEIKIVGLEVKKRDTLPKAEQWQREIIDLLLHSKQVSMNNFIDWAKLKLGEVFEGKLKKEDLVFQKRLSRETEDYGGTGKNGRKIPIPRHARIAIKLKEKHNESIDKLNLYSAGSYIPFVIIDEEDMENGSIHADEFKGQYDTYYYWSACYDPSKRILQAVFPEYDWDKITPQKPRKTRARTTTPSVNQQALRLQQIHTPESIQERGNRVSSKSNDTRKTVCKKKFIIPF